MASELNPSEVLSEKPTFFRCSREPPKETPIAGPVTWDSTIKGYFLPSDVTCMKAAGGFDLSNKDDVSDNAGDIYTRAPLTWSCGGYLSTICSRAPQRKIDVEEGLLSARVHHVFADANYSELSKCGHDIESWHRAERAANRRLQIFQCLRQEKGIKTDHPYMHRHDNAAFAKWSAISYDKTGMLKYMTNTPHANIFQANSTCILTPDNIIGLYFIHGEQIYSNIVEGHYSIPLYLEISFITT
ncbi:hypothetical protein S40293_10195 [Stachybotrys chartarum IBT 40293]|nr:hypothetical protein S40293_10195 [Stachybotrys chartarum IBT 40293]